MLMATVTKKKKGKKPSEKSKLYLKIQKEETALVQKEIKAIQGEVVLGRPSSYTQELADKICEEIASGKSMRSVSRMEGMPAMSMIFRWLREHPSFREQYTASTIERTEAFQEDVIDISDDGSDDYTEDNYMEGRTPGYQVNSENIQRSRLRVETRKWLMERMKPKKYGAKIDMTTNGKDLPVPILGMIAPVEKDSSEVDII